MVSKHPAKFGGHRYCGSRNMTFLVVEGQDFACSQGSKERLHIVGKNYERKQATSSRKKWGGQGEVAFRTLLAAVLRGKATHTRERAHTHACTLAQKFMKV